ncbi:MAG: helicase-exonuclease AddAB subunit AddA [Eubacteriales bacterium]
MGFNYTRDQQQVIELRNRNILVAAAAGSGKTAVLVERIIQLISDKENPVDIDRLLIVTFTSAAAAEMRERISAAIERRLGEEPSNEHMQKQATLIYHAPITTISSFCLNLIKNHFHDISLDPSFRVADEAECKLLKQEVLEAILEEYFEEGREEFLQFVETTSANGSERGLEELILKLHESSRSYPFPVQWLTQCGEQYRAITQNGLEKSEWISYAIGYCKLVLEGCKETLELVLTMCEHGDGPYMYAPLMEEELQALENMGKQDSYARLGEVVRGYKFGRLSSKKDESVSKEKREIVKGMRNQVKGELDKLREEFFYAPIEDLMVTLQDSALSVEMLLEVVIGFAHRFQAKKRQRGILDFSDMEQYALQILLEEKEGHMQPTQTACMYQSYYYEVLIDEYQDSNLVQEYLLKSVSKESSGSYNQFMVGDVKQSIYKFRLARPELFLEKYQTYESTDSIKQKIDLQMNFRSRKEVLESANYIFEQIMTFHIGGIVYDHKAALNYGASYDTIQGQDQRTELLLVEREGEVDKKELEARLIANRIRTLVQSFYISDGTCPSGVRLAKYSDMVILLRSNTGWDDIFKRILEEEGIPTHIASKTGYFSVYEVQVVLNYLRILDNPLQDIPLTSVLLSGMIGFQEEELAVIRGRWKEEHKVVRNYHLYHSLVWYTTYGENEGIIAKIEQFLADLDKYRQMTVYTSIHELLQTFLQEINFQLYLTTLPRGEQRRANLDMLLEKAIEFEQTSYHGLFHFIRYIEQMEKFEISFGEANILDEHANVVRIMSIHKSKGLEFPICFVSGLGKKFNQMDLRKQFVVDMDYGIGMDYIDPVRRVKTKTIGKSAILRKMELDNIGEEIRILYVALTRAKEKLIMTGVLDNLEKTLYSQESIRMTKASQLPFLVLKNGKSFLDLILAALARHEGFAPYMQCTMEGNADNFLISILQENELVIEEMKHAMKSDYGREQLLEKIDQYVAGAEVYEDIHRTFTYEYPFQSLGNIYSKTTVTEIKKKRMLEECEDAFIMYEDTGEEQYVPAFMREEKVSGMERGNAYHKAMEVLDLTGASTVRESIHMEVASGRMKPAYEALVELEKLEHFMKTPLGKRMGVAQQNGMLYKEQPFVISLPANEVEAHFPKEEDILLQGIIDAYFEEDGALVIVDYKTDRVRSSKELMERYRIQLEYYAKALSALTGKPVKEKVLYSFYLGEVCGTN